MSRNIELPDDLYRDLEKVAQEQGLSVAGWIAATIPGCPGPIADQTVSELLQGLIGAVDSTKEPRSHPTRTGFAELIARKFERQGLKRP